MRLYGGFKPERGKRLRYCSSFPRDRLFFSHAHIRVSLNVRTTSGRRAAGGGGRQGRRNGTFFPTMSIITCKDNKISTSLLLLFSLYFLYSLSLSLSLFTLYESPDENYVRRTRTFANLGTDVRKVADSWHGRCIPPRRRPYFLFSEYRGTRRRSLTHSPAVQGR